MSRRIEVHDQSALYSMLCGKKTPWPSSFESYALLTLFCKNANNQLILLYLKMDIPLETVMFLPVRPWVHRTAYPRKMGLRGGLLSERGLHPAFRYARLFS